MELKMKKLTYTLVLCGLSSLSGLALAADAPASSLSGNIGISTDYIFRGISQTQHQPEISGGFDYTHSSGLYVGTWLSNQDWVSQGYKDNSSLEVDLYGGYRGSLPADVGYDLGAITYYYPGNKIDGTESPDTTEIYAALSWKFLTLKDSYTVSKNFVGWYDYVNSKKTQGSNYLELNATYDLGSGWGVLGHVGHQVVKNVSGANYTDYKVGVTKDIGYGTVTLAYSDTNADAENFYTLNGKDISKGVAFLSFSKTF
jgi:uncharacterized protein (TIGR02001 family)